MTRKFLPHMSDVLIETYGKTFKAAFTELCGGMFTQMGSAGVKKESASFSVSQKANTLDELVVNSLSEILAECEIERVTPKKVNVKEFDETENSLSLEVIGGSGIPRNIIKAVTYHELKVEKDKKGNWTIRVLFDI